MSHYIPRCTAWQCLVFSPVPSQNTGLITVAAGHGTLRKQSHALCIAIVCVKEAGAGGMPKPALAASTLAVPCGSPEKLPVEQGGSYLHLSSSLWWV